MDSENDNRPKVIQTEIEFRNLGVANQQSSLAQTRFGWEIIGAQEKHIVFKSVYCKSNKGWKILEHFEIWCQKSN